MTRSRIVVVLSAAAMLLAALAVPSAATVARPAAQSCGHDFLTVPPVAPARVAHPPKGLALPPGVRAGHGLAFWAMASNATSRGASHVGYEVLAAPTGSACAGLGYFEDDISYATFWSKSNPSHAVTARFGMGQGGFAALCAYLAAGGRKAAAKSLARTFAMTLKQCRQDTPDLPSSAHARGVRLRTPSSAPFAVVVKAPRGSELTWPRVRANGHFVPGRRTTTPTWSVGLVRFLGLKRFVSPQSYDCALPSTERSVCLRGIQAFVAESLITSFRWHRSAADRAARKVVHAFG